MRRAKFWLTGSIVLIVLAATLSTCGVFSYLVYSSLFVPPSKFSDYRITSVEYLDDNNNIIKRSELDRAKAGDIIQFELYVTHYKDCDLEIRRVIKRAGSNTDIQLQLAMRSFKGDGIRTVEHYRLEIPPETLPGKFVLTNRLRYLCNPVDYVYPIYQYTTPLELEIIK